MSNDDTNEPTGARLTEAQVAVHFSGVIRASDIDALLADRAALVAENARLQHAYDMNETTMNMQDRALKVQHADLANTLAQATAMRPLVEALAKITPYPAADGDVYLCMGCQAESVYYDAFPHENDCRIADAIVMVATWQTPAAPEGGDHAEVE